jgi:hypothetical protein
MQRKDELGLALGQVTDIPALNEGIVGPGAAGLAQARSCRALGQGEPTAEHG